MVLLTGGIVVRSKLERPVASASIPSSPRAAAQRVTLGVETDPPGAQVLRVTDGQVLGKTPWHLDQAAQAGELAVRLRLAGYLERIVLLDLAKRGIRPVALSAVSPGPPQPEGRAAPSRHPGPTKVGKRGLGRHRKSDSSPDKPAKKVDHETLPIEN